MHPTMLTDENLTPMIIVGEFVKTMPKSANSNLHRLFKLYFKLRSESYHWSTAYIYKLYEHASRTRMQIYILFV